MALSGSLMPHTTHTLERVTSSYSLTKPSVKSHNQDAVRRRVNLNTLVTAPEQTDIHIDIVGAETAETKN